MPFSISKYFKVSYLFIFVIIIWEPFQRFVLQVDGAGISIYFLILITFLFYIRFNSFQKLLFNKPFTIWFIWILYSLINSIIISFWEVNIDSGSLLLPLITPFSTMLIIAFASTKNRVELSNVLIFSFFCYLLLAVSNLSILENGRLGGAINSNILGLTSLVLIYIVIGKYTHKDIKIHIAFLLSALPTIIILLSGSRKAFGGLVLIIILLALSMRKGNILIKTFQVATIAILTILLYNYILHKTLIGERLIGTVDQAEATGYATGTSLDLLGDRTFFYFFGWDLFKEHPVNGIGLMNFEKFTKTGIANHSEYMVQLTEGGIIGTAFFLLFYLWFIRKFIKKWSRDKFHRRLTEYYLSGFTLILFINLTTWTYSSNIFFIIFGMIISFLISNSSSRSPYAK